VCAMPGSAANIPIDQPKLARHQRRVVGPGEPLRKPDDLFEARLPRIGGKCRRTLDHEGMRSRNTATLPTTGVPIADSTVFYFSGKTAFLSENIETKYLRVIVNAFSSAL
jgi:hypothetical protein